jgi:hypothetical protein
MRFAHMKRILKLDRIRLRGLSGARDEVLLTATAQNLRRLAKLLCHVPPVIASCVAQPSRQKSPQAHFLQVQKSQERPRSAQRGVLQHIPPNSRHCQLTASHYVCLHQARFYLKFGYPFMGPHPYRESTERTRKAGLSRKKTTNITSVHLPRAKPPFDSRSSRMLSAKVRAGFLFAAFLPCRPRYFAYRAAHLLMPPLRWMKSCSGSA